MVFIISSCKNDSIEQRLKIDRAEIKKMASLHSKGLAFLKQSLAKTKGGTLDNLTPIRTPLEISQELNPTLFIYLQNNGLQEYEYLTNSIPGFNLDNLPTISLSQTGRAYSHSFYVVSNQLTGMLEPTSYQVLDNQINAIVNSNTFLNLNSEEQTILLTAAEVMLDSYSYWSNEYNETPLIATKGFFRKLWAVIKRDLNGAIGGAITAGVASRNETAIIAGAIAGAVLHSAFADNITEDEGYLITDGNTVTINGVTVPAEFDNIIVKPVLKFPTDYTGVYYYVSDESLAHNENLEYSTFIYKNNENKYYYTSSLTCLLPNGVYFNNQDGIYYKVLNGLVTEIGSTPTNFPGGFKPIQEVLDNIFPACN